MSSPITTNDGYVKISLVSNPSSKVLAKLIGSLSGQIPVPAQFDEEVSDYFATPIEFSADASISFSGNEIVGTISENGDVPLLPPSWKDSLPLVDVNWIVALALKPFVGAGISETLTFSASYVPAS